MTTTQPLTQELAEAQIETLLDSLYSKPHRRCTWEWLQVVYGNNGHFSVDAITNASAGTLTAWFAPLGLMVTNVAEYPSKPGVKVVHFRVMAQKGQGV